ncbi:MAG: hypothetical protein R6W75_09460 [Smithellaceae bacterium]
MDNFVRCKACGYISPQGKIGDVCPACGVPAKMFEPYKHPVSIKRRRMLDLHTHPVAVHFPQAFGLTLLLISVSVFFVPQNMQRDLTGAARVLSFLLPFFVILSIATGLFDGKLRFRKITTPFLKKKIALGLILFFISIALFALALSGQMFVSAMHILFIALSMAAVACGALLGLIGGRILDAKFPG